MKFAGRLTDLFCVFDVAWPRGDCMISNIHRTVLCELDSKKPKYEVMNHLIVSFCALALNELRKGDSDIQAAFLKFVSAQLEFAFRLVHNYQDFLGDEIEEMLKR